MQKTSFHMDFPQNNHFLHENINVISYYFQYFFTGLKLNENLKNDHTFSNKLQLIILRTYVHYLCHRFINQK